MTRLILLTILILSPAAAVAQPAGSSGRCSCSQGVAPCAGYWSASAVFLGRVDAIARTTAGRTVKMTVLEGFRGVSASTIEVSTSIPGSRCGFPFTVGREYVVYASRDAAGRWTTGQCSRTREVEDAAADLSYARGLKEGSAGIGHITGQVRLGRRDLSKALVGIPGPLEGIEVRLSKDGVVQTAVTNQAGDFGFDNSGTGIYVVSAQLPDRYYTEDPVARLELADPRSCAEVNPVLFDNGRIAGRVLDAANQPVAGLTIEAAAAAGSPNSARTITDRQGRYEIDHLPRGSFVVGLNVGRSTGKLRPAVFYPGVQKPVASSRIVLAAGERLVLDDLRIPIQLNYVSLSGIIVDADGLPADGARVYLKGLAEHDADFILAEPVVCDSGGRFVIAALAGAEYRLFAEKARPGDRSHRVDSTDQVRFTIVDGMKPLRLILRRHY